MNKVLISFFFFQKAVAGTKLQTLINCIEWIMISIMIMIEKFTA